MFDLCLRVTVQQSSEQYTSVSVAVKLVIHVAFVLGWSTEFGPRSPGAPPIDVQGVLVYPKLLTVRANKPWKYNYFQN